MPETRIRGFRLRPRPQAHGSVRSIEIIVLTFVGGFIAASILVALGVILSARSVNVWSDIAGAGVQVGVVTLLGAGITLLIGQAQSLRDEDRRVTERARDEAHLKAEYRLRVFRDVVAAYNGVKAVRRQLRALGLGELCDGRTLTAEQTANFHQQMSSLIRSQLSLEQIKREVCARRGWFLDPHDMAMDLRTAERYVNGIISEWEKYGRRIEPGVAVSEFGDFAQLRAFLGDAKDSLKPNISIPLERVESKLRDDLYAGEPAGIDGLVDSEGENRDE